MQHCKREYCNAGTRQWSQRGIYIRKASKAKNSEQIIIRSNDSRYRGYPKTEKNAIQQRGVVTIQEAVTGFLAEKENTIKLSSYLRYEQMLRKHILPSLGRVCVDQLSTKAFTSFLQQKQIDSELSQKTLKDIGTLHKGVVVHRFFEVNRIQYLNAVARPLQQLPALNQNRTFRVCQDVRGMKLH